MIKKFNEYFSNKMFFKLKDIISYEEVEDQFLRLKEVLNCPVQIFPIVEIDKNKNNNFVLPGFNNTIHPETANCYFMPLYINDNNLTEVEKELDQIKFRIECMFPSIKMEIDKNPDEGTQENLYGQTYYEVWIREMDNNI